MARDVDWLYLHCKELLTLAEGEATGLRRGEQLRRLGLIPDGAVAVHDGKVVATGPTSEMLAAYRAAQQVDLSGFVVVPGFVDVLTDPELACGVAAAGVRDYDAVLHALGSMTPDQLQGALRKQLDEFLLQGTTAVGAAAGHGIDLDRVVAGLACLPQERGEHPLTVHRMFAAASRRPAALLDDVAGFVRMVVEDLLPAVAAECDSVLVSLESGGCRVDAGLEVLLAVQRQGLVVRAITVGDLRADQVAALPAGMAAVAGLERASTELRQWLSVQQTGAVLLPLRELGPRGAMAPARAMIDAGCALVLGSGHDPLAGTVPSIPMVIALANRVMRVDVDEALSAVTINAAASLGLDRELGSLHVGKRADLVALELGSYRELADMRGGNPVALTVVAGVPVVAHVQDWEPHVG